MIGHVPPPSDDFTGWCPCGCGEYWVDGQAADPPTVRCPAELDRCSNFDCVTGGVCRLARVPAS